MQHSLPPHLARLGALPLLLALLAQGCQTTSKPATTPPDAAPGEPSASRSTPPAAPANGSQRAGSWEVTLGGAGSNDEDFEAGGGQLAGSAGYFLTDAVQLVGRQNLAYAEPGPGTPDAWNGSTRLALDLHLLDGPLVPFVGGSFGWVYGDTVRETLIAAPEAGVKWYVRDDAFFQAMAEYQFFFENTDQLDSAVEDGNFVYGLAIGLRF